MFSSPLVGLLKKWSSFLSTCGRQKTTTLSPLCTWVLPLMGIGGKKCEPTGGTQKYKVYKAQNIKAGATAAYDGVSFTIPAVYNNSKAQVLVSKAGM